MSTRTISDTQISLRLSNPTSIELVELVELVDPGKQLPSLVMKMLHILKRTFFHSLFILPLSLQSTPDCTTKSLYFIVPARSTRARAVAQLCPFHSFIIHRSLRSLTRQNSKCPNSLRMPSPILHAQPPKPI
jgi:hypothetical protein